MKCSAVKAAEISLTKSLAQQLAKDQIRVVGGIDFNNLTGFINEPRTWGVQFRANFTQAIRSPAVTKSAPLREVPQTAL